MPSLPTAAFARDWQEAWNAHDLPRILAHYAEDVVFRKVKAQAIAGDVTIRGRSALKSYWGEALARQPGLRSEIAQVFRGPGLMVIRYCNQHGTQTIEVLEFGPNGLMTAGAACHETPPV